MITPNISLANGSGSVSGIGIIESGGTTGGGGAKASIVHGVHYSYLTEISQLILATLVIN
jgi:hypothetical protein